MAEEFVIFNGRGGGKTYTIMTMIHELILAGERPWIMVVFPTMGHVHWWGRMWMERFPSIPMPNYTSAQAMDRVRGRRLRHVFIEDVETIQDGYRNEKFDFLWAAIAGDPDATITYTCSGLPEQSWRQAPPDWTEEAAKLREKARREQAFKDAIMIAHMQAYIRRHSGNRE
jgi:hypothetical protein